MDKRIILPLILLALACPVEASSQEEPPQKLHGKALKLKAESIEVLKGTPDRPYHKLGPVWASKRSMKATMEKLKEEAARLGADAVIQLLVKTEKLVNTQNSSDLWGGDPAYQKGWGPWGGPYGTASYWAEYVKAHSYVQPVVSGWAVQWKGPPSGSPPPAP